MCCSSRGKTGPVEAMRVLPLDKRMVGDTCVSSMCVTPVRIVRL